MGQRQSCPGPELHVAYAGRPWTWRGSSLLEGAALGPGRTLVALESAGLVPHGTACARRLAGPLDPARPRDSAAERSAAAFPRQEFDVAKPVRRATGIRLRTGALRTVAQRPPRRRPGARPGLDQLPQDLPVQPPTMSPASSSPATTPGRDARQRHVQRRRRAVCQVPRLVRPAEDDPATGDRACRRHDHASWPATARGERRRGRSASPAPTAARITMPGGRCRAGTARASTMRRGQPAQVVDGPGGALRPQSATPLQVIEEFRSVRTTQAAPGGIRLRPGAELLRLAAADAFTGRPAPRCKLIPGELLDELGLVSQQSSGGPMWFSYTLRGGGTETWSPRFSYYGFRYVQVEGAVPDGQQAAVRLRLASSSLAASSCTTRPPSSAISSARTHW